MCLLSYYLSRKLSGCASSDGDACIIEEQVSPGDGQLGAPSQPRASHSTDVESIGTVGEHNVWYLTVLRLAGRRGMLWYLHKILPGVCLYLFSDGSYHGVFMQVTKLVVCELPCNLHRS